MRLNCLSLLIVVFSEVTLAACTNYSVIITTLSGVNGKYHLRVVLERNLINIALSDGLQSRIKLFTPPQQCKQLSRHYMTDSFIVYIKILAARVRTPMVYSNVHRMELNMIYILPSHTLIITRSLTLIKKLNVVNNGQLQHYTQIHVQQQMWRNEKRNYLIKEMFTLCLDYTLALYKNIRKGYKLFQCVRVSISFVWVN